MSEGMTAAAPAAPVADAPVVDAGSQIVPDQKTQDVPAVDPFEFDLDVKGKTQKLKFENKEQLKAVLQKALYADQQIKDAAQAKKGAAELMQKLKTEEGLLEILRDPEIGLDIKKFSLNRVREMMDDEQLTPEQREARQYKTELEQLRAEKKARQDAEAQRAKDEKNKAAATRIRTEIIESMKKFPDLPATQATLDGVIQNMRAAFTKFNMKLSPEQAVTLYNNQYWKSMNASIEKMTPEQILTRFGQKTLDKIQQLKLQELRQKMNPKNPQTPTVDPELKKKKSVTEKDFEKHFKKLAGL